jgi:hypothetical protein
MKLIQLNEKLLLEKEVSSATLKNIELSKEVKDLADQKLWQQAYDSSGFDVEENQLYDIKVEYQPTKGQLDYASKKNGKVLGYDGLKPIIGYLKENPNRKDLENMAKLLVDVVDTTTPPAPIEEGYFSILPTKEGATPYSLDGAKELIKELKSVNSGIKSAKEETVRRQDLGYIGSERDLVVQKYLEEMFPGNGQQKIKDFKDVLVKLVKETGFDNNPAISFLQEYLKNYNMTRVGFICLNNLWGSGVISEKDLVSSSLTTLLKSDLLVGTPTADATEIIEAYKELIYTYDTYSKPEIDSLSERKNLTIEVDKNGSVKKEFRKNLADAVVFKSGLVGKQVEPISTIKNTLSRIKTDGRYSQTTPATSTKKDTEELKVVGEPKILSPEDETKYDQMLQDFGLKKGDIPSLMAYLKSKNLVG